MRSSRLALTVTALALLTSVTACSGGSDDKDDSSTPAASSSAGGDEGTFTKQCSVEVEVTGAAEASWSGKATVSNASGVTAYQSADGKDQLIVYAGNDDIQTNANLTVGGATFTTTDPEVGLEVAKDGSGATVDAPTSGVSGDGPQVTATFTCGKAGKGGKGTSKG
ncbi:hypothetical protein [Nocardioides mangrovi]|uniref:Lipoprotein antigen n=1 Tax=Nocardioides mangrovi TaxID=2874580 RepID=A0ABS7UGD6_9ACTN|nr:hypothetical protein [Nocardioides mangrovi]MBZ5740071.1 hypothetical protein [Nocardioides mangrovi]